MTQSAGIKMPDAEHKKAHDRNTTAEKSERANRSSPFVRWRSLREPKSLRGSEADTRLMNTKRAATDDDMAAKATLEPRGSSGYTNAPAFTKAAAKTATNHKLGVAPKSEQKKTEAKDSTSESTATGQATSYPKKDVRSHSSAAPAAMLSPTEAAKPSAAHSKKLSGAVEPDPLPASAADSVAADTAEDTAAPPSGRTAAELSRTSNARRSLRILFSRSASVKQKSPSHQQPTQLSWSAGGVPSSSGARTETGVHGPSLESPTSSAHSSGEKPSKLVAPRRTLHKPSSTKSQGQVSRESYPQPATSNGNYTGVHGECNKEPSGRTGPRPASLNESLLRMQRPSLRMSPVCLEAGGDDWHSGVSLSSLSSSESSIAAQQPQQQEEEEQKPKTSPGNDGSAAGQADRGVKSVQQIRMKEPLSSQQAVGCDAAAEKPGITENGHAELSSSASVHGHASVTEAGGVRDILVAKALNVFTPVARSSCNEATIVAQLTEEVQLLKNGLIHCEAVLREEETARRKLEQELCQRDSLIESLRQQLALCRCRAENGPGLPVSWPNGAAHTQGLSVTEHSIKEDDGYAIIRLHNS